MIRNNVYAKIAHICFHPRLQIETQVPQYLILRHGYVNFEQETTFNPDNNAMISKNHIYDPDIFDQDWYWNPDTQDIQTTPP